MAGPVSALCWISPLCSEGNGFRGTNLLSVSWSGAEQIAGLKKPTTHCYKSIKHLQLTIHPPASAAEHVNSCDQITAQLTAFTCAISKGEILAWLCPLGSWTVTRTRLFGRLAGAPCSLTTARARAQGSGQRQPGDSGTSACPSSPFPHPVRGSGCCGKLSQDLILMELGNRAHGGSPGVARCVLGCSPPQPHHTCAGGNSFYFSTPRLRAGFGPSRRMLWGARISPGCPCPSWHAGLGRSRPRSARRAASPRAGTPRLRRRRRSAFASAAAASGPLAAGQLLMFPLALVRRGIQENNRQRWGLSRSGSAGQRSPARGPVTGHPALGLGAAEFRGLFWD